MISVRRARPADAIAIAAVHVAAWRSAYPGILPDTYPGEPVGVAPGGVLRRGDPRRHRRVRRVGLRRGPAAGAAAGIGPGGHLRQRPAHHRLRHRGPGAALRQYRRAASGRGRDRDAVRAGRLARARDRAPPDARLLLRIWRKAAAGRRSCGCCATTRADGSTSAWAASRRPRRRSSSPAGRSCRRRSCGTRSSGCWPQARKSCSASRRRCCGSLRGRGSVLERLHPDRKSRCKCVIPAQAGTQAAWVPASALGDSHISETHVIPKGYRSRIWARQASVLRSAEIEKVQLSSHISRKQGGIMLRSQHYMCACPSASAGMTHLQRLFRSG